MTRSNARGLRTALVGGIALTALVACTSSSSGHGSTGTMPGTNRAPSPPSSGSASSIAGSGLGAELQRIALHDGDLDAGYRMVLVPSGAEVRGQVTLDNCGFDFTTEAHRVARRQYGAVDSNSRPTGLINELAAYDSAQQAAKAVAQWHTAAARCPRTAVRSRVAGTPKLIERITRNQLNVATLPIPDNTITTESVTERSHGTFYNISILQAKGRILDNIYVSSLQPLTQEDMRAALRLASITGQRLAESG